MGDDVALIFSKRTRRAQANSSIFATKFIAETVLATNIVEVLLFKSKVNYWR